MTITHQEMVAGLKKPGADILATLTPEKVDAWHMASCIVGEGAELFDAVRNQDAENVLEEIGDNQFYIEGLRQIYNITRQETIDAVENDEIRGLKISQFDIPMFAGNVFDAVKKHLIYNKEFNRPELVKALGMYDLAIAAAAIKFGISYQQALAHNIAKLGARYKGHQYSDKAAQERADKTA